MKLTLSIATPERLIYEDEVDFAVIPAAEGEVTILPGHAAFFTKIKPGEIRVKKDNEESYLAVTGGFLEVSDNKATILADYAIRAEEIEEAEAEEAKKKAEETMKEKRDTTDFLVAEAELRKAILELRVVRRKHQKPAVANMGT